MISVDAVELQRLRALARALIQQVEAIEARAKVEQSIAAGTADTPAPRPRIR